MKVIIVDDERNARESIQKKLKQISSISEITEFGNPFKALDYASEHPVDIAFLDIEMPALNGMEMATRLSVINPAINIVYITGFSQYGADAFDTDASDFLVKPVTIERIQKALSRLRNPVSTLRIRVQCFGNFEVFINDKPMTFSRTKSKEALAYLVDRKGAGVSKKELAAVLHEDEPYNRGIQSYTHSIISEMMESLTKAGAGDIVIKERNQYSVDVSKFSCDLYRYENGETDAVNSYRGEYMTNYTWAEFSTGLITWSNLE